jgi:hypothetical protein
MIKPGEIQNKAREVGVRDQQIEKDYILSWILQGIAQHEQLSTTITFKGELCRLSTETGTATAGTYSFTDSTISSSDCTTFGFELSGNTLILNYQCIEACRGKFLKQ